MKQIFALMIAGSFLFVGCGGGASGAVDLVVEQIEKKCECKKLAKDGDNDGAEACAKEYKAWKDETFEAQEEKIKEDMKEMSPEELKEFENKIRDARKTAKAACKESLK